MKRFSFVLFGLMFSSLVASVVSGSWPRRAQANSYGLTSHSNVVVAKAAETDESAINEDAVDTVVHQLMASRHIPGVSLAVVHEGKLIKTKGYGFLNRELSVKARPSSLFPIASMSKPLTATGLMLLVEAGKVDLDAPISTYIAKTPEHWADITVRHLLTHTAGLSESVYSGKLSRLAQADKFVRQAAKAPLDFQPGESWMYSNTGYYLAAIIIENVSGQPFETFMKARVFDPLAMEQTDALRASYVSSNQAMGYALGSDGRSVAPIDVRLSLLPKLMPSLRGAGSVTSTVLDIARWEMASQKGALLSLQRQEEMQQPVVMNSGLTFRYGLGWILEEINGRRMVSHGGNLWGYSTSIARFPDDQLTVIMLTNKDDEQGDYLARKVAEQYVLELKIDADAPAIADENPALTAQLLSYVNGHDSAIEFVPEWRIILTTPRGQSIQPEFAAEIKPGTVEALALVSQSAHANGTRYRYRAQMQENSRLIHAVVTADGQVASIGLLSE